MTNLRKKEIEYQQKMGLSSNDSVRLQEELEALKNQKIGKYAVQIQNMKKEE